MQIDNTQLLTTLDAVNYVLTANGLSPRTSLQGANNNRGIQTIISLLSNSDLELQTRAYSWNTIHCWDAVPDANKEIELPDNTTNIKLTAPNNRVYKPGLYYKGPRNIAIRRRGGKPWLFDATKGIFTFERTLFLKITQRLPFEDIPTVARQYIVAQAANRYNSAHVNDSMVRQTQLERIQEARALLEQAEDDANDNHNTFDYTTQSLGRERGA